MLSPLQLEQTEEVAVLRLQSADGTNRLTAATVRALTEAIESLARAPRPLLIAGNRQFFSVGADLTEIAALDAASAYEFAGMGQSLMNAIARFPVPVCAAISGYCMGGGLDLALACRHRIAAPGAVFGHRGAALGLVTGWGGTQRLPRLIGKARALEMFVTAEKVCGAEAARIGLVDALDDHPEDSAIRWLRNFKETADSSPP